MNENDKLVYDAIKQHFPHLQYVKVDPFQPEKPNMWRVWGYEQRPKVAKFGQYWTGRGEWPLDKLLKDLGLLDYVTAQDWKTWGLELIP
jgi:hypothetical protein